MMRMKADPLTGYDPQRGRMRIAPLLIAAIPAVASLISAWIAKSKGSSSQAGSSSTTTSSTIDPRFQPLLDKLLNTAGRNAANPYQLPAGYEVAGANNVNRAFEGATQNLENKLAGSGQLQSPAGAAGEATLEGARGATLADFQNSLPMLREQRGAELLKSASSLLPFGVGSTSVTNSTGSGTTTPPNNAAANSINNLAYLWAQYQAGRPAPTDPYMKPGYGPGMPGQQ